MEVANAVPQDQLRGELAAAADGLLARAAVLQAELTTERLAWRPPGGGWSIGQVLEHLVVSGRLYLERMRPLIDTANRTAGPTMWRPTLVGGLLVRSMASPRRFPAPTVFAPGPVPRDGVLAAYVEDLREVRAMLDRAAGISWREIRLSSPVSRLMRVNLGDCFALLVRHAERHGRQTDRLRRAQGTGAVV
jgi:hypothetical protein